MAKYNIFISYRRSGSEGKESGTYIARAIKQQLEISRNKKDVFFDYSEMTNDNFEKVILKAIKSSKIFISILTSDAMLRCDTPTDWVRREITQAKKYGLKLIFINPDNQFNNEYPEGFPEELTFIKSVTKITIHTDNRFNKDIDNLINNELSPVLNKLSVNEKISEKIGCSIMALSIIVGILTDWGWGLALFVFLSAICGLYGCWAI